MQTDSKHPVLDTALQTHPSRWSSEAVDLAAVVASLEGDKSLDEWIEWLDEMGVADDQPS